MVWQTLGESVAGSSHRIRSVACQDAFRYGALGNAAEWLVVVVADGAGSATHSDIGSTLACDAFLREASHGPLERLLAHDGMAKHIAHVRSDIIAKANELGVTPRDLACTLLAAVVGPQDASFAQIGDGAIVLRQGEGYRTVFWPEPTEYVNATSFLTDDQASLSLQFEAISGAIEECAVFTDGLQRLALDFESRTPHTAFFKPVFDALRSATDPELLLVPFREFLDSERINERTDDDKTLVIAVRRHE